MAQRDLIVSFLSGVPASVRALFDEPPLYLQSPIAQTPVAGYPGGRQGYQQWLSKYRRSDGSLIPGMWKAAGGQAGDTIGRVAVMGFSNGCIGVDEVLRGSDSNRIDAVIACDGIHGGYVFKHNQRQLHPPSYKRYINHAALCVSENSDYDPNSPVMVITHSVIKPPFPSTTETASLIWHYAYIQSPEDVQEGDCDWECPTRMHLEHIAADKGARKVRNSVNGKTYTWHGLADGWYDRRAANNLYVFGWGDVDAKGLRTRDPTGNADHIFQGQQVLPAMLNEFVVSRWNADCGVVVATAGLGQAQACVPGKGRPYGAPRGPKVDYVPDLPDAVDPITCPPPPAGRVLVGSPSDPCATAPAPGGELPAPTPSTPSPEPTTSRLRDAAIFMGAAAGGYALTSYWSRRR